MKIGIDCRIFSSEFTGIGRYTHELVTGIIRLNNSLPKPHELVLFFNEPQYLNFTSTKTAARHVKKVLVNAKHYSLAEQTKFLTKLNQENLDIVHFPHFNVPILYLRPFTVTIHDLTLSIFPGQKMTKWYHRLGYQLTIKNAVKKTKKVIAVSNNTKNDIQKFLKIPPEKIAVIYNGVSPDFKSLKNSPDAQKSIKSTLQKFKIIKPFLLYTGVWRNHKNLPKLLHAFHILKTQKNLKNLQMVITGKEDTHYPEVKNTIKKLKLQNDVILPGLVDEKDLINLYNAASIFVFPSLYEGFGLPPLEAMACGTPVAASNTSSIPEICGKENAIFFDPENINDIAEKIAMLYKDTDLQAKLVKQGLAHAATFSLAKTAEKTFKIITENV